MIRKFTCIICPNGCEIEADITEQADKTVTISSITGHTCPKGKAYVEQELTDPKRNIATSILVKGGELPLASVRLTKPIPKAAIFAAVKEIKRHTLTAPVKAGTAVIHGLLGYDADVIVTKTVERKEKIENERL